MDGQGQLAWKSSGRHMATAFRTRGAAGWIGAGRKIDQEFDIYRSLEILTHAICDVFVSLREYGGVEGIMLVM
jgi:hypothetical protein